MLFFVYPLYSNLINFLDIDLPPPNAVKSAYIKLYRDNARKILEASANKSKVSC